MCSILAGYQLLLSIAWLCLASFFLLISSFMKMGPVHEPSINSCPIRTYCFCLLTTAMWFFSWCAMLPNPSFFLSCRNPLILFPIIRILNPTLKFNIWYNWILIVKILVFKGTRCLGSVELVFGHCFETVCYEMHMVR